MNESHYQKLKVWQKARRLTKEVYVATRQFPRDEIFGLTQQMRRAVISIVCNIAEGQGRSSRNERRHFTTIARGSTLELEAQIVIATDLDYVSESQSVHLIAQTTEIARMLNGLLQHFSK